MDEVFRTPMMSAEVKVFLLFLACNHMSPDGRVSESRAQLAQDLNCYERRVSARFEAAIGAGFMERVSRGQKGRTAVYRALIPNSQGAGNPPAEPSQGADNPHPEADSQGAKNAHPEHAQGAGNPPAERASGCGQPAPHMYKHLPVSDQRDGGVVVALFDEEKQQPSLRSKTTRAPAPANGEHPAFAEWYAAYPIHKARGAAVKAFANATEKTDTQTLIDAAKRYRDDEQVRRGYAKHPATWLNQECWLDEAAPPPTASAPGAQNGGIDQRMTEHAALIAQLAAQENNR